MKPPDFSDWLEFEPYGFNSKQKSFSLTESLVKLNDWHFKQCPEYKKILNALGFRQKKIQSIEDLPYIPVRLFKEFDLLSVDRESIFKTMMSSGTSGQSVSKIYLDRATASIQTKILSRIIASVIGRKRLPMLIIDSPNIVKDRSAFSARGAGILGFSMFGLDVTYALNESMELDLRAIESFLARHPNSPLLIFGFTFMIWNYFVKPLQTASLKLPLSTAIILHGGGWKKLQADSVDNMFFKSTLNNLVGVNQVVNYYGMVEQTGALFIECEFGHLHCPIYADIIIRSAIDFSIVKHGEEGIIQVISILPLSYPGHSLLTEDIGTVLGEDDCPCSRLGKYFHVKGRIPQAEVRGCSDTHEIHL